MSKYTNRILRRSNAGLAILLFFLIVQYSFAQNSISSTNKNKDILNINLEEFSIFIYPQVFFTYEQEDPFTQYSVKGDSIFPVQKNNLEGLHFNADCPIKIDIHNLDSVKVEYYFENTMQIKNGDGGHHEFNDEHYYSDPINIMKMKGDSNLFRISFVSSSLFPIIDVNELKAKINAQNNYGFCGAEELTDYLNTYDCYATFMKKKSDFFEFPTDLGHLSVRTSEHFIKISGKIKNGKKITKIICIAGSMGC